jgi:hypothetical protein
MALFGRGVSWVYREIAEGRLKAVKDGRNTLVLADSVEARIAKFTEICTPTMALMARQAGRADAEPDTMMRPVSPATGPKKAKRAAQAEADAAKGAGKGKASAKARNTKTAAADPKPDKARAPSQGASGAAGTG